MTLSGMYRASIRKKQLFLPEMAEQTSFELSEMASCSKETTLPNPSTTEARDIKREIFAPLYLQDKVKRSQGLKPFSFSACALRLWINSLYTNTSGLPCKHTVVHLSGTLILCHLHFLLFDILIVVSVCYLLMPSAM